MEPIGMDSKNCAITGHGCQMVKPMCRWTLESTLGLCSASRKSALQCYRRLHGHDFAHIRAGYLPSVRVATHLGEA